MWTAEELRAKRERAGISRRQLAKAIKKSPTWVERVEGGEYVAQAKRQTHYEGLCRIHRQRDPAREPEMTETTERASR